MSLKRNGGHSSAAGVLSAVLKGILPLSSSNIALQRSSLHASPGHHESVRCPPLAISTLFPRFFTLLLQLLASFPQATRRQAETIVALAPARRALVQHHRSDCRGLDSSRQALQNKSSNPFFERALTSPSFTRLSYGGWESDNDAAAALSLHWVSSRLMVRPLGL
jgi:hypothetical protein